MDAAACPPCSAKEADHEPHRDAVVVAVALVIAAAVALTRRPPPTLNDAPQPLSAVAGDTARPDDGQAAPGVDGACGHFDADVGEPVPPATDAFHVDVSWRYEGAPFELVTAPSSALDVTSAAETTIARRRATRIAGTGEGLLEAGVASTLWVVDLGEVDGQRVALLGGAAASDARGDYAVAVEVLDGMADQLVISGP